MKEKLYCKSGGCSAKLGAKKLTHILEKIAKYPNSNLLVGFDSHEHLLKDCQVYQEIYESQNSKEGETNG